jgi:hypothetical protein
MYKSVESGIVKMGVCPRSYWTKNELLENDVGIIEPRQREIVR